MKIRVLGEAFLFTPGDEQDRDDLYVLVGRGLTAGKPILVAVDARQYEPPCIRREGGEMVADVNTQPTDDTDIVMEALAAMKRVRNAKEGFVHGFDDPCGCPFCDIDAVIAKIEGKGA
ncbi:hypothetical protein SAMN04488503_2250 [Humidesulfovibrio mexicanus]|uniref:Uncharacterized protein n=1 Tax=Humidesulfovibrio mexicanus TaxID=147047 RepID=A0A239AVQ1_9BACT|nr:hypothetical protein [Humidesulfovibrio mexicanus]SNR99650.1 hypothetical protein SAMN04488503_2250 [Humidesulfovibrio mexicanus]